MVLNIRLRISKLFISIFFVVCVNCGRKVIKKRVVFGLFSFINKLCFIIVLVEVCMGLCKCGVLV